MGALLLVLYAIVIGQSTAPGAILMQDLSVAPERLPAGCAISPDTAGLPLPTSPWTGTDPVLLGRIRELIDGPPLLPDGPPPSRREYAQLRLRLADGIEEGYVAVYQQDVNITGSRELLRVFALRFADARKAAEAGHRWANNPRASRTMIGSTVAVIHGDGGKCFQAVAAHLRGLAGK
jgi:hypothetical protein